MRGRRGFMRSAAAFVAVAALHHGPAVSLPLDDILFDPDAPLLGNPRGDVTIACFYDYQCGYCRRAYPMLMDALRRDPGLRLVMKDWPLFGQVSLRATRLALGAVDLGRYGAVNAALLAGRGRMSDDSVDRALRRAGMAPEAAWRSYLARSGQWDRLIQRNHAQADALGFRGTPSYVVGRAILPGALDAQTLQDTIARARG